MGSSRRYSIIHLHPSGLDDVFADWFRVLEPGAPALVEFFGSRSGDAHGAPFDHKVATAYELFHADVGRRLQTVGFAEVEIEATPTPEGGRPYDHTTILARKSSS